MNDARVNRFLQWIASLTEYKRKKETVCLTFACMTVGYLGLNAHDQQACDLRGGTGGISGKQKEDEDELVSLK